MSLGSFRSTFLEFVALLIFIFIVFNTAKGASSDIQQATKIAKMMVTKWGMSDKVGLFFVDEKEKQSGEFQQLIDDEVRQSHISLTYYFCAPCHVLSCRILLDVA